MEYVLTAIVAAVVAGGVVLLARRPSGDRPASDADTGRNRNSAGDSSRASGPPSLTRSAAASPGDGDGEGGLTTQGTGEKASPNASGPPAAPDRGEGDLATTAGRSHGSRSAVNEPPERSGAASAGVTQVQASARQTGRSVTPASGAAVSAEAEVELRERRAEIARIEERVLTKENSLEARIAELARREQSLEDRARNLTREAERLKSGKREHVRELERVAGLSAGQAKQILLKEVEDDLRHERARLIRQAEEEAKHDADRRARSILAACMQRVAGGHAVETTVSVVALESEDLKGRVIGREGRNIRALETLTGIDFIIDDTPGVVALSGFDGVRREVARLTLEKLLQDGRIHPARIEDAFYQSRSEIENRITEAGEQAVFEAGIGALHPELTKLLGRLKFRTSYGQNVLAHSVECSHLAALISEELGASSKTARRAALLHDVGKAVSHEVEGPHALVGGQIARRHNEVEAVAHAMEAHHNEVDVQTIEAVVVQIADALSGARPGARGESLEAYTKRLRELEEIAGRRAGVDRVYAMQAGREVRVIVRPEDVDDDTAAILSHEIAREVERELEYAGQIKVTVIRESRATDYAK